jgi:GntR family transcriptional regulator
LASLDPTSDRPAYRQIADQLRDGIARGEFSDGGRLPSERELCETYSAARGTVRQAVALLRTEGLIEIDRGRGAYVRDQLPVRRVSSDRFARMHRSAGNAAFIVEAESAGQNPVVEVIDFGPQKANPETASRLGVRPGAKVMVRRRRYLLDGRPMELATSYLPWAVAEGTAIAQENPGPGGIYARLEDAGHLLRRMTEELSARMPSPEEVRALHISSGVPVITLLRTAFGDDDRVLEVCDTVMVADRYVLEYDLPVR